MSKETVAPAVSDFNPRQKPRVITVTAELSLAVVGDKIVLSADFGSVKLLRASFDPDSYSRLVSGNSLALPVEVPAWGGSIFSEES